MGETAESDARRGPAGLSPEPARGVLMRLNALRNILPTAAQQVADYILRNPAEVARQSVTEVAEAAGVSEGTVVRLCQQLGVKGFQDLKLSLAYELIEPVKFIHEEVRLDDEISAVIQKVFRSDMRALEETLRVLDPAAMEQAVSIILDAERVEFYGIGSSGPVAVDAYYRMMRIGLNCVVTIDSHMQAVSATQANERTAVVTISHSGSTKETVEATRLAKEAGAKTIVITSYGKSPIQAYADVVLATIATETMFRTEAMASRIAELTIVDALYVCVALANVERSLANLSRTAEALSLKRF
ncbi:MAG: transcriptional regulator [Chloroflexi bacterium]|nr:MAG: transcriptional regulator [Chloroflexota bacterium]